MFSESIRHFHPDITEQSVSQLREFLVTAHQRQQSDSQALSIGLQALKQEVLDEGFDWNDLFTNLVELLSADMQEEQHERFVAQLDSLNSNNSSLLEVGDVMKADYPSVLDGLQLLIQVALEEHEELAGMAGGTSNHPQSTKKTQSDQFKREKAESVAQVLSAAAIVGGVGIGAVGLYRTMRNKGRTTWKPREGYEPNESGQLVRRRGYQYPDKSGKKLVLQTEDQVPFESLDPRRLEREANADIDKAIKENKFSLDSEDRKLFEGLNNEIRPADQTNRLIDRTQGAFDNGLESKVASGATGELEQGKEVAETEVKAEARAAAAEAGADIEAGARNVVRDTEAAVDDAT